MDLIAVVVVWKIVGCGRLDSRRTRLNYTTSRASSTRVRSLEATGQSERQEPQTTTSSGPPTRHDCAHGQGESGISSN